MADCAKCHESVWVPDGYDFEDGIDLCGTCMGERIAELEAQLAEARKVVEAARYIRHWGDAYRDGSGMVVSSFHVRDLWDSLEKYDAINAPRTDCPACMMGQDASKGEGTHLEGTRQHPQEPA